MYICVIAADWKDVFLQIGGVKTSKLKVTHSGAQLGKSCFEVIVCFPIACLAILFTRVWNC